MATVRDLISGSLRLLGVRGQGEAASGAEATDALAVLNELIDSFNATGSLLYTTTTKVYPLVSTTNPITFGPTGMIVETVRPTSLVGAWWRDTSNNPANDFPLTVLSDADYGDIVSKGDTSQYPYAIYMDRQWPNANIYLWPAPSDTSKSLVLQFSSPLSGYTSLNDTESLPPAYRQMLRFNLAMMLAPEYGLEPPQSVMLTAISSRQLVEQANFKPYQMEYDIGNRVFFNVKTGVYI